MDEPVFWTKVNLPCKVICERITPQASQANAEAGSNVEVVEFLGTAMDMDPGSLSLNVGKVHGDWVWEVGQQVRLEMELPVHVDVAKPKAMIVRARIARIQEMPDGTTQLEFRFRKPSFRDRRELYPVALAANWMM